MDLNEDHIESFIENINIHRLRVVWQLKNLLIL
jgi:hypothetical protein